MTGAHRIWRARARAADDDRSRRGLETGVRSPGPGRRGGLDLAAGGLEVERDHVTAAVRAVLQLAVVAAVIAAVMESLWWSLAFVLLMFTVATATSHRRIGAPPHHLPWVALSIAAGAGPVIALCLGSDVIPLNGAGVIPISGIVIGGAMTASTLTGRRAFDELSAHHGIYEAPWHSVFRPPTPPTW